MPNRSACRRRRRHALPILLLAPVRRPQAATLAAAVIVKGSPVSIGSDGSRDHSFQEPK
jgi:hypothetical protein